MHSFTLHVFGLIARLSFSAFSIFAFIEYFVAAANMGFYWTIVCDLPDERIIVMRPGSGTASSSSSSSSSSGQVGGELTINGKGNAGLRAKKDD